MKNTRNYGIDTLRVLAMLFIVSYHILGHGGALRTVSIDNKTQFAVIWFIEVLVFCGVNCFALVSGYVGYKDDNFELKLSSIIKLWVQVFFWGIVLLILEYFMVPANINLQRIAKAVLPVTFGEYWYFSAYFCLYFFRPLLNKVVFYSKKDTFYIIAYILIFFSFYSTFAARFSDPLNLNWGRSFLWLVCLYLLGAWLKKLDFTNKYSNKMLMRIMIILLLLTWFIKIVLSFWVSTVWGDIFISLGNFFIMNLSPTILIMSICLLLLFSSIKENKLIKFIANCLTPIAFGVYIIHENGFVKEIFIIDKYGFLTTISFWKIPIAVFGSALLIYLICAIMEWIRILIFKICKVDKFALYIENRCYWLGEKLKKIILKDA